MIIAKGGFSAPDVEENYTRARDLCERLGGDPPQLFPVLWGLARMHDVRGELKVGRDLRERLLKLAERAQEPALFLEAHHQIWANLLALGELTSAWLHMEQGFVLYDSIEAQRGMPLSTAAMTQEFVVHTMRRKSCGFWAIRITLFGGSRESLALARELAHPSTLAFATFFGASFDQLRGEKESVGPRRKNA